jgi:RNA polymerase sigma-70 factor (ECF subfamily)
MKTDIDGFLVKKFKSGDKRAFDELVLKYQQRIYELAYNFTHHVDDAFDLSQEIFLRVFKALDNFKGESAFYTWLYRIAKNACIDYTRKRKRYQNVTLEDGILFDRQNWCKVVSNDMPDKHAERKELEIEISKAIEQLPPRQKQVFILRHYEGLALKEIAEKLGLRIGSVKAHLFNATHTLRKLLTPYVEGKS